MIPEFVTSCYYAIKMLLLRRLHRLMLQEPRAKGQPVKTSLMMSKAISSEADAPVVASISVCTIFKTKLSSSNMLIDICAKCDSYTAATASRTRWTIVRLRLLLYSSQHLSCAVKMAFNQLSHSSALLARR